MQKGILEKPLTMTQVNTGPEFASGAGCGLPQEFKYFRVVQHLMA
jgi:hypothetical protein